MQEPGNTELNCNAVALRYVEALFYVVRRDERLTQVRTTGPGRRTDAPKYGVEEERVTWLNVETARRGKRTNSSIKLGTRNHSHVACGCSAN